ncbi:reverse transcriptase family protein [Kocuria sp. CCUG 69068]|uniref:reverse transcriptase family protein n=1 Tax=Kocuria sp. CCUG 69068 TaxID=2043138 RepID=UPI001E292E37
MSNRGGSRNLFREIQKVNHDCSKFGVSPIYTLTHLCVVAKVAHKDARDVIFNHQAHYKSRRIKKKSGSGYRTIYEPSPQLKSLQKTILHNCLPTAPASELSFAFETGRNTLAAAGQHVGARAMIHVDVRDFFTSVASKQIYSVFHNLGYPELLSLEMALISTVGHTVTLRQFVEDGLVYEILDPGYLPQGASTSGKLSNMVCADLDEKLSAISHKWGGVITRYADDITFSSPVPLSRSKCTSIYHDLRKALLQSGFVTNSRKTKIFPNVREFKMLGLCVGQENVWLNKSYKKTLRAHLYSLEKFGIFKHSVSRNFDSDLEFMSYMWGHYAYCANVDKKFAGELRSRLEAAGIRKI